MADLGIRLVREGLLTRAELEKAVAASASSRKPLPHVLVALGLLSEETLVRFFHARHAFDTACHADVCDAPADVALAVPREMAEEFGVLAIRRSGSTLSLAMVDPSNEHAIRELSFFTGCHVVPLIARPSDVYFAIERVYPQADGTMPGRAERDTQDDAVVDLVTRRSRPAPLDDDPGISRVVVAKPRARTADGPSDEREGDRVSEAPILVLSESAPADPDSSVVSGVHTVVPAAEEIPNAPDDLGAMVDRLRGANSRDEILSLAIAAASSCAERAALFVIKKGIAQGWDARGPGIARSAFRNVWIPLSAPGVLHLAATGEAPYIGAAVDTIPNGILAAAMGGHPDRVGVWPVIVRDRVAALLYLDGFADWSMNSACDIVHEIALGFERIILSEKRRR